MSNDKDRIENRSMYTESEKKEIRMHMAILFIIMFLVLSLSAMKALIEYSAIMGYRSCIFIAGILAYYTAPMVCRWKTEKGWWIYGIIIFVILLMMARSGL